ncbi:unnamed protein product [Auanema sp. JU1783]|nr:unnamed protein product [Auanema sp. JU1783]
MGALLDRLRGRPRIQPVRIREVWNSCIVSQQEYFHKVLLNVIRRNEGMRDIFMASRSHAQNDEERDFVLGQLANRITGWFGCLIMEDVISNISEFRHSCYTMGQQHAAYSKEPFKIVYWDEFMVAMIEELEEIGGVSKEDLKAWQTFLHIICEHILSGYQEARATMRTV